MDQLKKRILMDARILKNDVIKVDGFINHQLDIPLINEIGKEFKHRFENVNVDKILTIEASGIAIAAISAQYFEVPVVFAKKSDSITLEQNAFSSTVFSYTKNVSYPVHVSRLFLEKGENVLILDDFLANGQAILGLLDILNQAESNCVGIGIVIEKGFQSGGQELRKMGLNLQSLAIIESINEGKIVFSCNK